MGSDMGSGSDCGNLGSFVLEMPFLLEIASEEKKAMVAVVIRLNTCPLG